MLKRVITLIVLASALIAVNADDEDDHSHTGRAGTLVLEPSAGFPGDLIHATGTGWIASYLPCEYRLYFDGTLVASQGPLTRYEQPNMTFTVPENATEGVHQVCIYLVIIWYGYETPVQRVCTTFEVLFKIRTVDDALRALDFVKLQLPSIMPEGDAKSVSAKLDAAIKMILEGNFKTAINQLQAAINELNALAGKTIAGKTVPESRVEAKKRVLQDIQDVLQEQQEVQESVKITLVEAEFTDDTLDVLVEYEAIIRDNHLPVKGDIAVVVSWLNPSKLPLEETEVNPRAFGIGKSPRTREMKRTVAVPSKIKDQVVAAKVTATLTAEDAQGHKFEDKMVIEVERARF